MFFFFKKRKKINNIYVNVYVLECLYIYVCVFVVILRV